MEDDPPEPEAEKPRWVLLPEGCKDLIDALNLKQWEAIGMRPPPPGMPAGLTIDLPEPEPVPDFETQKLPETVALPDPVTVRDLASALNVKAFRIIGSLIGMNIFVSINSPISFETASAICSTYGVTATKIG